MKILPLSDLHFELHADEGCDLIKSLPDGLNDDIDMVILAGDICSEAQLPETLHRFSDLYTYVLYIWGNHECYGESIAQVRDTSYELEKSLLNLYVLDNRTITLSNGMRVGGTTLWFQDQPDNFRLEHFMRDFEVIHDFRPYDENREALKYLHNMPSDLDIVVTHHLPSPMSVHEKYEGDDLNRFFLCDVEDVIKEKQPRLWVHGHTHESCDYTIFRTRVVCNPFGYPHELNPNFDSHFVIEVSDERKPSP